MVKSLIVRDAAHRPLSLSVTTELIGRGSLQVYNLFVHLSIYLSIVLVGINMVSILAY